MHYLFSKSGFQSLEPFLDEGTLLAFDFDGTLAPIVKNPHKAALPASTARLLKQLGKSAPVALISGRRKSDLKSRSNFGFRAWIGNHGMEGIPGRSGMAKQAAKIVSRWQRSLEAELAGMNDLLIEDKTYSLTIHYRASKRRGERKKLLLSLADGLEPQPRILPGKCVVNLLVPGHPHKGTAVRALLERGRFSQAIFVGDDDTDEDVFKLRDPRIFSIRVGKRKKSLADTYLKNQLEVESLLQILLDRHIPSH